MGAAKFQKLLQEIVQDSGIRQTIIAQAMDLSPAALSQYTHGSQLPTLPQLRSLLDLLCVPYERQGYAVKLLKEAKKEAGEAESEDWDDFEEEEEEEETEEGTDDDEEKHPDLGNFDNIYTPHGNTVAFFQETPINAVPVVHLSTLADYDGRMGITDFAYTTLHDTIIRDYGSLGVPVIVKTCGNMIGLRYSGMVQVVLCDTLEEHLTNLRLQYYHDGSFHLLLRNRKNDCGLTELLTPPPKRVKKKWCFPVLELTIVPLPLDAKVEGDEDL